MRTLFYILMLACVSPAFATTYFLDSSVSSSGNGLAWGTAWKNFSNITGLHAGDVVNISGGASGQTYNTGQFLSASGSSGNPITYQAATDAGHNGVVTINQSGGSNFIFANGGSGFGQWITFNGNVAGGIVIQGWGQPILADSSVGQTYRYTTIKGQMHMNGAATLELDHVTLDLPSGGDRALQGGLGCNGTKGYAQNLIHDSIIMLRWGGTSGFGDDGIGGMECTAFYNNQVLGISDPSYPGSQHQDGIQTGGEYVSIYNNFFNNMQNYPIYGDQVGGGTLQHWRIYNNVFYDPITSAGNQAVSIGCDGTTCTQNDIIVANNTAVANTNCIFLNQGTAGTLTNAFVNNNICYNSGALQISTATSSNNTTSTTGITFVNPTSNWHLTSSATNAIGQGISPSYLTSVYTTDKDGLTRTAPWDIGAFEFNQTWYIRTDGGTRWSVNATSGQCDGLADVAYPGSGTNQHCAFNDFRWLYDDQTFAGTMQWVIAGGDTVIIRGCASGPTSTAPDCRIGSDTQTAAGSGWCPGVGNAGCFNPAIPAGTAGQHTRILGQNYAACSTGTPGTLGYTVDKTKLTQLFGGWGAGLVLNLTSTQYVDIQCLQLWRHSQCIFFGSPATPAACNRSFPSEDDYVDSGIAEDATTANVTLQDMWIHGMLSRGIIGPIGGIVTATRVDIDTNGGAGWDFDDGSATPFGVGATLNFFYSTIQWNGCNQEYPFSHAIPVASCYSQGTGGYGDGIGTPNNNTGLSVNMNYSRFLYNTQDAYDFGHVENTGYTFVATNNFSFGNGGGGMKWSDGFTSQTAVNNIAIVNCFRMSQPITGTVSTYNANLADFCRSGDAVAINTKTGDTTTFANNTIVYYAPTGMDLGCNDPTSCATSVFNIRNNIFVGYDNPATYSGGGQAGGPGGYCLPGCNATTHPITLLTTQYNDYFGVRTVTCPTGNTGEICTSPALTSQPAGQGGSFVESELDVYLVTLTSNLVPTNGSPVSLAGNAYSGHPVPFNAFDGAAFTSPPPMGAFNPAGIIIPPMATFSGTIKFSGSVKIP